MTLTFPIRDRYCEYHDNLGVIKDGRQKVWCKDLKVHVVHTDCWNCPEYFRNIVKEKLS